MEIRHIISLKSLDEKLLRTSFSSVVTSNYISILIIQENHTISSNFIRTEKSALMRKDKRD